MIIVGCDCHPSLQQIAYVDTETGEWKEQRLEHRECAEAFYRELASRAAKVRVGMEASGHARWFERLLAELEIELWLGDAAVIRAKRGRRKPKTDRQDAQHILPKAYAAKRGCGGRKDENNWRQFAWPHGRAGGGRICRSCWMG